MIPQHLKQFDWYKPHQRWLAGDGGERANLRNADLRNANLRGASLMRANLSGADLRWAVLSGADLREANLSNADLSEANLSWVDLRWAILSGANLDRSNLRGANLSWADLTAINLSGVILSGANLREANLRNADLRNANLAGANLSWADLRGVNLSKAAYSPLAVLQSRWDVVSNELCAELMRWDASAHPNPEAFQAWADGGDCPLNTSKIHRCLSFSEDRKLYQAGPPQMTLWELWVALTKEMGISI
jgi:hypothetical protein